MTTFMSAAGASLPAGAPTGSNQLQARAPASALPIFVVAKRTKAVGQHRLHTAERVQGGRTVYVLKEEGNATLLLPRPVRGAAAVEALAPPGAPPLARPPLELHRLAGDDLRRLSRCPGGTGTPLLGLPPGEGQATVVLHARPGAPTSVPLLVRVSDAAGPLLELPLLILTKPRDADFAPLSDAALQAAAAHVAALCSGAPAEAAPPPPAPPPPPAVPAPSCAAAEGWAGDSPRAATPTRASPLWYCPAGVGPEWPAADELELEALLRVCDDGWITDPAAFL